MTGLTRTRAAIAAAVVAVALLGAACGDGDGDDEEAGGRNTATTAPVDADNGGDNGEGSGSDEEAAAEGIRVFDADPCTLLTAEEVGAALGGTATEPTTPTPQGDQRSCHWFVSEHDGNLTVYVNDLYCEGTRMALEPENDYMIVEGQRRVDDVGDGAIVGEGHISVAAHGGCFSMEGNEGGAADRRSPGERPPLPEETLLDLARTATDRLG